jgi:hypothetical protein
MSLTGLASAPVLGLAASAVLAAGTGGAPLLGLQPFPYDFSQPAVDKVHELAAAHSTLYVVHRDNGIPWAEALANVDFPAAVQRDWADFARRAPRGRPVYLALAPLAEDRESLAAASEGSSTPSALRGARFDDDAVERAYLNYAERAVAVFRPDFLNLGVEAGELAARRPERWPAFAALYEHVRSNLKKLHPELRIGISFGLQTLMRPDVADRVRSTVDASDYVGLSFYPYMSAFHQKYGARALPAPPAEWREPLAWVRKWTSKPLAVCETGYSTRDVDLPRFGLSMRGSEDLQKSYVSDLVDIAQRDRYLFVVWSMPVDYEELYKKLPPGDGRYLIWQNTGLFDRNLRPRPAWEVWTRAVGDVRGADDGRERRAPASGRVAVGFEGVADLFVGPPTDRLALEDGGPGGASHSMRWSYEYAPDHWQWCVRDLARGSLLGRETLRFFAKSDREGQIFLQVEEDGGEAFYVMVSPRTEWQEHSYRLADLTVDPKKRKDGRLDPARINRILLADNAGAERRARGRRSVWLSKLEVQ